MTLPDILELDVTQEDIDRGQPKRANECMLALAIKRKLPGLLVYVSTNDAAVYPTDGNCLGTYNMDDKAYHNRQLFDLQPKDRVKPFSCKLELKK